MTDPKIISALRGIAKKSGGVLIPEQVVEEARPVKSVLHGQFCWDDDEAARQYRLWQARVLIRTTVHYIEIKGDRRPVRVFVSLTPDREEDGGGYRDIVEVLQDKDMRRQMIDDALGELEAFEKKYAHLKELAAVFVVSKSVRSQLAKPEQKAA